MFLGGVRLGVWGVVLVVCVCVGGVALCRCVCVCVTGCPIHTPLSQASEKHERLIAKLLQDAQTLLTMPALAHPHDILIRDTAASNSLICQPQQRNTAGRIFGGFLMRRAFELAYATAYLFSGSRPTFEEVGSCALKRPGIYMYIYIYVHICMYMCMYVYVCIYYVLNYLYVYATAYVFRLTTNV